MPYKKNITIHIEKSYQVSRFIVTDLKIEILNKFYDMSFLKHKNSSMRRIYTDFAVRILDLTFENCQYDVGYMSYTEIYNKMSDTYESLYLTNDNVVVNVSPFTFVALQASLSEIWFK